MSVLQDMLPRDLLHYCQEHGLLDSILIPESQASSPQGIAGGYPQAGGPFAPP